MALGACRSLGIVGKEGPLSPLLPQGAALFAACIIGWHRGLHYLSLSLSSSRHMELFLWKKSSFLKRVQPCILRILWVRLTLRDLDLWPKHSEMTLADRQTDRHERGAMWPVTVGGPPTLVIVLAVYEWTVRCMLNDAVSYEWRLMTTWLIWYQ